MNAQELFNEFKPVSKSEWKAKIISDLGEKDFDQLIWHTTEGIAIQPFYTQEDLKGKQTNLEYFPGNARTWENLDKVKVYNPKQANQMALEALAMGADGIIFEIEGPDPAFDLLLKDVYLNHCSIYFSGQFNITGSYFAYAQKQNFSLNDLKGGLLYLPQNQEMDKTPLMARGFKTLFVNGTSAINGKNNVHELASALRQIVVYMDLLTESGIEAAEVLRSIMVKFEISPNYFKEIAKLRAFRILLATIAEAYQVVNFDPAEVHIHCETSGKQTSEGESYKNMLSNTTEAMSAILGRCDSLYVVPHDGLKAERNDFSRRMARNISLILKEEAYFDKVTDPASGSYFIETLTERFAEEAWQLFLTKH